jgi:flagellar hook protein FlgE
LAGLVKVNVTRTGEQATPTTAGTFSANLPSMATRVAVANAPAAATAATPPTTPSYTEKTSLVTYDNLGAPVTLDVYMTRLPDNPAANPAATPPVVGVPNWEVDVFNSADAAPGGGFPYSTTALTSQVMTFNPSSGQLASGASLSIAIPNGQTMALSFAGTTQLATGYAVTGATTNGNAPDTLTGVTISTDGTLSFNYSSGTSSPGYDIPLANVASPDL